MRTIEPIIKPPSKSNKRHKHTKKEKLEPESDTESQKARKAQEEEEERLRNEEEFKRNEELRKRREYEKNATFDQLKFDNDSLRDQLINMTKVFEQYMKVANIKQSARVLQMRNSVEDNMSIREEDDQRQDFSVHEDSIYSQAEKRSKVGPKTPATN